MLRLLEAMVQQMILNRGSFDRDKVQNGIKYHLA
jgi:hypothetical protein